MIRYNDKKHIKRLAMNKEYKAIVKQDGDWWIGWIEEVPGVNCQERTHDELISSLRIALKEALEFNRQDALAAVGTGYQEEKIAI
jgi:predicted RNase H-like HicB family nuclease